MGGPVGLRPGLLRQVVPKRAVLDAVGSLPVRHEGRFTDTPLGHAYGASTPRLKHVAACGSKGRSLCRGWLALPASERKPVHPSRGEPSRPWLHSGQGGLCVLVLL